MKAQAEDKIDHYEATYGLDKWTLTNAAGQPLTDDYTFTENATVFIITKQTSTPPPDMITITVAGDTGVILKEAPTFEVTKGKTWNEIESLAESKIKKYKQHHELKNWHLINDLGPVLDDSYITTFNADTTVFIETKPVDVKLTIKGDHINITSPAEIYVSRGTKWSEIKDEVMGKVSPKSGFVILAWKKAVKPVLNCTMTFNLEAKRIYTSKQDRQTLPSR